MMHQKEEEEGIVVSHILRVALQMMCKYSFAKLASPVQAMLPSAFHKTVNVGTVWRKSLPSTPFLPRSESIQGCSN
jgi:hypothetical protein